MMLQFPFYTFFSMSVSLVVSCHLIGEKVLFIQSRSPAQPTLGTRSPIEAYHCSMYKLYCHDLNERLSKWVETHNIILDNQNGFRKQHSTVDQIMSLTIIIETRKRNKLSTYCAFIDFKKAYDYVDRKILWERLQRFGVSGRMLSAVKSLYSNITACVKINGMCTDWFTVRTGLRQGCLLSPILFNLFIDDLAVQLQAVCKGIL